MMLHFGSWFKHVKAIFYGRIGHMGDFGDLFFCCLKYFSNFGFANDVLPALEKVLGTQSHE